MSKTKSKDRIKIGGNIILPGQRRKIQLSVAALYDYTDLTIPIEVIRGIEPGPTLFLSGAIHGDELNGVEIIKQLLQKRLLRKIKGTLIAIPVVNIFGYNHKSRYLPDRRDLNRSFPGKANGSLAAQLAHKFMKEVVSKCTHGIDLHTGAVHRTNLPQIRASLDDPQTYELANAFGAPVIIHSQIRDGSLREAARKKKVQTLLFEGGEALRYDEQVIKSGLQGCLSVMRHIGMLPKSTLKNPRRKRNTSVSKDTYWCRAPHSGSYRLIKKLGDHVETGEVLGIISDPFGADPYPVTVKEGGIIIGLSTVPLVNKGDAIAHIATFKNSRKVKEALALYDII